MNQRLDLTQQGREVVNFDLTKWEVETSSLTLCIATSWRMTHPTWQPHHLHLLEVTPPIPFNVDDHIKLGGYMCVAGHTNGKGGFILCHSSGVECFSFLLALFLLSLAVAVSFHGGRRCMSYVPRKG